MTELVIDNFAGGGGASTGIEAALGRPVDYAINHDPAAIAMHRVNHPRTHHLTASVWDVNPQLLAHGRPVGMGWFSPDCTFHSKARGGRPFRDRKLARRRRGLAGIVPRWLAATRMKWFFLENVEEFASWGPLLPDGRIDPKRRGMLFRRWHRRIEDLGYRIDMRELVACRYGAPTTRKRLFVVGKRIDVSGEIVFPEWTHGPERGLLPYRTAAECIDFTDLGHSIFLTPEQARAVGVKRPLADATLRRIARGVVKYVLQNPKPFIVQVAHGDWGYRDGCRAKPVAEPLGPVTAGGIQHALVVPTLINTRNGERPGQEPRTRDILRPYGTITAEGSQGALVATFLAKHYGGHEGSGASLRVPFDTITTRDHHALVAAFLMKYYGSGSNGVSVANPLDAITCRDRFGLVTVQIEGEPHYIADIRMRMLKPRELYLAQSFPPDYVIDHGIDEDGEILPLTNEEQVRMCGNSVPPVMAEAIVRANYVEQAAQEVAA